MADAREVAPFQADAHQDTPLAEDHQSDAKKPSDGLVESSFVSSAHQDREEESLGHGPARRPEPDGADGVDSNPKRDEAKKVVGNYHAPLSTSPGTMAGKGALVR